MPRLKGTTKKNRLKFESVLRKELFEVWKSWFAQINWTSHHPSALQGHKHSLSCLSTWGKRYRLWRLFIVPEVRAREKNITHSSIKSLRPPWYAQHHKPQLPPYSSFIFTLHPESERVDKWGEGVQGLSPLRTGPCDLWRRSCRLHDD